MTPTLETKYVFTITAKIGEVITAGETGIGVRRIIPIIGGPKLIYCRTVPKFETGHENYRWLMQHIFVASAARHADRVVIDVHQVM